MDVAGHVINMKGMQKRKAMGGPINPREDTEITGFEVQPIQVLIGSLGFVLCVILLHFWSKLVGGS